MSNGSVPRLRRCPAHTAKGTQCKRKQLPGFTTCFLHLTPAQKLEYQELHPPKPKPPKIPCRAINKQGEPCKNSVLIGMDVCWEHASASEREEWKNKRRRGRRERDERLLSDSLKAAPGAKGKHKPYDGFKVESEGARILEVDEGEVYGFYNGVFIDKAQRELFKSAPVGEIDDDIKIIRYLIREALSNQVLYNAAVERGDVEHGFVVFAKESHDTIDEDGNQIMATTRIIRRRRDYLQDIKQFQALLTKMEQARIEINKAKEEEDEEIVPFTFNMLPPSNPSIVDEDFDFEDNEEAEEDE